LGVKLHLHLRFCSAAAVLAWAASGPGMAQGGAAPTMEAGAWQLRVTVYVTDEASGAEQLVNETLSRFCFSPAFVAREPYLKPRIDRDKMAQRGMKCEMTEPKREADTVNWTMRCEFADGRLADSAMKNSVQARSFTTEVLSTVTQASAASRSRILTEGRHTGECQADMKPL